MLRDLSVPLFSMLRALDNAMDLVSPALVDHHKRVAYIAASIAATLGASRGEQHDLLVAGMLHDIGALSLRERLVTLRFEEPDLQLHAERGYALLAGFELLPGFAPFASVAPLIRFHHLPWQDGLGARSRGGDVPAGSHILHLADRVAVLLDTDRPPLVQAQEITEQIAEHAGSVFVPELVRAFQTLATKEYFWLDAASPSLDLVLARWIRGATVDLDLAGLSALSRLFSEIIDFRSPFTAAHSSGVAATAEALAAMMGFSETECRTMRIAGGLHDLGKLAVPVEILEKPGPLTAGEYRIVKTHTYYTYRVLESIPGLETINQWGAYHHERLDGNGYPFHLAAADLPLGSRIVAVADTFAALTEDRPYRKGMAPEDALALVREKVQENALDGSVVAKLESHFAEVNALRQAAQAEAARQFAQIREALGAP
ncbi:MAG: HD domain-containing protein [Firmicutes bacterium]|nr:HD domain-containing protein [Bacillota bacterium]